MQKLKSNLWSLTDAVVSQVACQALPLVLRIAVPLPLLELLAGQILVLRLPLRPETPVNEWVVLNPHRNNSVHHVYSQASCTEHRNSSGMTGR